MSVMTNQEATRMITVRLPISLVESVDDVAERLDVPRSIVLRDAIREGLRDTEGLARMYESKPVRELFDALKRRNFNEADAQLKLDSVVKWMRAEEGKKPGFFQGKGER